MENTNLGRPKLNNQQIELIVHKLEPYLKRGFSVRKACYYAELPHSTVYDLLNKNQEFSDKIELFKLYKNKLLSDIFMAKLEDLHKKYVQNTELSRTDWSFLKWLATNDKTLKSDYGKAEEVNRDITSIDEIITKIDRNVSDYNDMSKEAAKLLPGITTNSNETNYKVK